MNWLTMFIGYQHYRDQNLAGGKFWSPHVYHATLSSYMGLGTAILFAKKLLLRVCPDMFCLLF